MGMLNRLSWKVRLAILEIRQGIEVMELVKGSGFGYLTPREVAEATVLGRKELQAPPRFEQGGYLPGPGGMAFGVVTYRGQNAGVVTWYQPIELDKG
jgi:hypothetical protein